MANEEHLAILRQGAKVWNEWRKANPDVKPDFIDANLWDANLTGADLEDATLKGADLSKADLTNANLRSADFWNADLWRVKLFNANLMGGNFRSANLRSADLTNANLRSADLGGSDLTQVQALVANFEGSTLTGACIQDWNINADTNLNDVICDYVYLKGSRDKNAWSERRPSDPNKNFDPGDFAKLVQKSLNTVDLIFRNGVDWQALLISLDKLRIEANGAEFPIQAIENKDDGDFVVRLKRLPKPIKQRWKSLFGKSIKHNCNCWNPNTAPSFMPRILRLRATGAKVPT